MTTRNTAIIIGAGFGGLSLGIRLQSLGFDTTIVEIGLGWDIRRTP